jgi:hypothetical protein
MLDPAHTHVVSRIFIAAVMAGCGLLIFARPCFASPRQYFKRIGKLPPRDRQRIDRVLSAREASEGIPAKYGRYLGLTIVALGGLELLAAVPLVLPYALLCLALAAFTLLAYLRLRRATERRVAPLVRRSALRVLSPPIIVAMSCSFVVTVAIAGSPPERLSAIVAAAAMAVLGFVAWRIAEAPALLLGDDPQWEHAVDAHLRICRSRNVALLVCAMGVVAVGLAYPALLEGLHLYAAIALNAVYAAFIISGIAYVRPLFQTIHAT